MLTWGDCCCNIGLVDTKDFTSDDSKAFLLLLKEADALPNWLVEIPDDEPIKSLPSVAFADTTNRMMPIHTKAATFLSAVSSLVYDYPSDPGWENRIKAACAQYGIEEEVRKAHEAIAPAAPVKQAAAPTKKAYALELEVEPGGPVRSYYPINSADEVEASGLKMAKDLNERKLPESWFSDAAEALVKAAQEHGLNLSYIPQNIRSLAEDRLPSPEYLAEQIDRRVKHAGVPDEAAAIYKQAADGVLSGDYQLKEAAHLWELADRKFNVRYTDTVVTPLLAFRSGITKEAFEKMAGRFCNIAGVSVPFNQLSTLSDRLVASVLPRETASVVLAAKSQPNGLKAASVLHTLDENSQLQVLGLVVETADV